MSTTVSCAKLSLRELFLETRAILTAPTVTMCKSSEFFQPFLFLEPQLKIRKVKNPHPVDQDALHEVVHNLNGTVCSLRRRHEMIA